MNHHILISINTAWNVYNFRRNLISFLLSNGYKITVLAPRDEWVTKIEALGCNFIEIAMRSKSQNPLEELLLVKRYKRLINKINPDICLFYTVKPNLYGTLAAKQLGIPVICNISGLGTSFLRNTLATKFARLMYRLILPSAKVVFFQNIDDKRIFIQEHFTSEAQSLVIPGSGIDLAYFKPLMTKKRSEGTLKFLMPSRLIFDKGIREYIYAAKMLSKEYPYWQFEILGKAEHEAGLGFSVNDIEKMTRNSNIVWHGERPDVRPFFQDIDVIVLPSYREGLSKALLEAAALQKPIVTCDVPGCREVVDDGINGFLCKAKDENDLLKAMRKMGEASDSDRLKMGVAGREKVSKIFNESHIFNAYLDAIQHILT